jgi:hypothetical protein
MKSRALVAGILGLFLNLGILFAQEATEKPIVAAAQMWLHEIDSGHYAASWQQASTYFQGAVTERNWMDALNGARRPLGNLVARKVAKTHSATSLPGAPTGTIWSCNSIPASRTRRAL